MKRNFGAGEITWKACDQHSARVRDTSAITVLEPVIETSYTSCSKCFQHHHLILSIYAISSVFRRIPSVSRHMEGNAVGHLGLSCIISSCPRKNSPNYGRPHTRINGQWPECSQSKQAVLSLVIKFPPPASLIRHDPHCLPQCPNPNS